jgi:hypothetical protein
MADYTGIYTTPAAVKERLRSDGSTRNISCGTGTADNLTDTQLADLLKDTEREMTARLGAIYKTLAHITETTEDTLDLTLASLSAKNILALISGQFTAAKVWEYCAQAATALPTIVKAWRDAAEMLMARLLETDIVLDGVPAAVRGNGLAYASTSAAYPTVHGPDEDFTD